MAIYWPTPSLKGERLSFVLSPDGTLISASAAPHYGDIIKTRIQSEGKFIPPSLSLSHTLSLICKRKKTNKSVVDSDSDIQCVMYRKQGNKVRRRANIPLNYAKRFLRALLLIFTSSPASPLHPFPVPHGTWRHEVHIPLLQFRPLFDVVTRRRRTHRLKWCHIASFHGARQHFQHSVMGIHYGFFFFLR